MEEGPVGCPLSAQSLQGSSLQLVRLIVALAPDFAGWLLLILQPLHMAGFLRHLQPEGPKQFWSPHWVLGSEAEVPMEDGPG